MDPNVRAYMKILPVDAFGGRQNKESDLKYTFAIWNEKDNYCFSCIVVDDGRCEEPCLELGDDIWARQPGQGEADEIYMGSVEKINMGYDGMLRKVMRRVHDKRWMLINTNNEFETTEPSVEGIADAPAPGPRPGDVKRGCPALTIDVSHESLRRVQYSASQIFEQRKCTELVVRKAGSKK